MSVEAYQIGVSLVADATRVVGPIGEMIEALTRLTSAQREAQMGFNSMVSSLGAARRLASGLATDMNAAARAAREFASASARFRTSAPAFNAGGGAYSAEEGGEAPRSRGRRTSAPMPASPVVDAGGSYVSPYSAAATNVPGAPMLMLPPPRAAGTALVPVPGSENSYGAIPNFRRFENPADYEPDWMRVPSRDLVPYTGPVNRDGYWMGGNRTFGPWQPNLNAPEAGATVAATYAATKARLKSIKPKHEISHFVGPLAWIGGAAATAHFAASGFDQSAAYEQTFLGMMGDPVARANMGAIRASAQQAMKDNPFLAPVDAARIAQESYELAGGEMGEQSGIAHLINRVDKSFLLLGKSREQAMRESIAFMRGQDITNRFFDKKTGQFSMAQAEKSTDTALSMIFANRQFMRGQNFQQFAKSAGAAGMRMSDEGMFNFSHFIDINPSRASTALKSFEDLFLGNHTRMTDKDLAYFSQKRLGLMGKHGQFVDQRQLAEDPIGWITAHIDPLLKKNPELVGYFQRMNVQDLVNETHGAEGNVRRQADMARRTDAGKALDALAGGPKAAQAALATSFERFEFTIGRLAQGPLVKSMNTLTGAFNGMSDFVTRHPDDIKQFADDISSVVTVLGNIGHAVGTILDAIPGPLRRPFESALAGGAIGGAGGAMFGGVGAGPGAVAGATSGLLYGFWHEAEMQILRRLGVLAPERGGSAREERPSGQAPSNDTHVNVYLDGQQIASHVDTVVRRRQAVEMRASNSTPDPLSSPRYSGTPWGAN
ncbi:hypothetical protein AD952_10985 [Acetobacter cerevisiae]|uniref:Uncharacterized protein n=1 Tax=Acetobacter cerevisiae TaxID=178900 RepID=A0A149USL1_9PROT|nr:hypothetical protein [Acetobacter cerevisiae]KXV70970.1 hypothetical protein AD952_10985 [Acetobacter cerevisiae]